jgi:septum site-determining protein MinD
LNGTKSPAAKAYSNIAGRLQGEDIPLLDPSKERLGLRATVRRLMQTKIF